MVKITVTSKTSGRTRKASYTAKQLVEKFIDEADLVQEITMCNCQPVGETNVVDCNCDEEWEDCTVVYEDELLDEINKRKKYEEFLKSQIKSGNDLDDKHTFEWFCELWGNVLLD